jgi:hypothetical protein
MAGPRFHDQIAQERDRITAGDATECGFHDDEHELTCIRAEHPHEHDELVMHVAIREREDGTFELVQWQETRTLQPHRPAGELPGQPKGRPSLAQLHDQLATAIATSQR